MKLIKRGMIFMADLNPVIGSEQGGARPVLIVQNNIGNKYSPTVIIVAITTKIKKINNMPTHCHLVPGNGLENPSIVLLEHVRTIDKTRLNEYLGRLNNDIMKKVDRALKISLELSI